MSRKYVVGLVRMEYTSAYVDANSLEEAERKALDGECYNMFQSKEDEALNEDAEWQVDAVLDEIEYDGWDNEETE